jgi:hypothetical protein
MIIVINNKQYTLIKENIDASEAHSEIGSIQTVIDGKRNVGILTFKNKSDKMYKYIKKSDLNTLEYFREDGDLVCIFYNDGFKDDAVELMNISLKYNGYLSVYATEEDSIRIGQILGYTDKSISEYILRNRYIRNNQITCVKCGWNWMANEAGDDKFTCHKCGTDSSYIYNGIS